MRIDSTDLKSIQDAEMLPNEVATVEIVRIREAKPTEEWLADGNDPEDYHSPYSYAECRVKSFDDETLNSPELIGREVSFTLINERHGRRGIHELVKHKVKYNEGEGWEKGIPADENGKVSTKNLIGVVFKGKIRSYEWQGAIRQEIRPRIY